MVRNLLILLILFTIIENGCLRKQKNVIQEPAWPRYKVEGWVYDTTTLLPIDSATVIIVPYLFLFSENTPPETTFTDSSGYFLFEAIPASAGTLKAYRADYHGLKKEVVIQKNRVFEIFLKPRP